MALIDNRGRLFGKVSVIDLGAALVVLVAMVAIFLVPANSQSVPIPGFNTSNQKPVEVDVVARRVSTRSAEVFKPGERANIVIRNQPYGEVDVVGVEDVSRSVPVVLPDGSIERVAEEQFIADIVVTVSGQAAVTSNGIVLGNSKVKVGVPIELETFDSLIHGTVMEVRILDDEAPAGT
ncbi:MAG: DUF4330 domain-containing protein [Cyanobacteria bacterium P01_E01_bin.34]